MKSVRIVLTGGPGGGKSKFIQELLTESHIKNVKWLLVPEAAPPLFSVGIDTQSQQFQLMVLKLAIAMEDICFEAAQKDKSVVMHRGTLDVLAYWLAKGWRPNHFFKESKTSQKVLLSRYDLVIHFETTAFGAQDYYQRWPAAHRFETIIEAQQIDRCCNFAWHSHPNYVFIENNGKTWKDKSALAHKYVANLIK